MQTYHFERNFLYDFLQKKHILLKFIKSEFSEIGIPVVELVDSGGTSTSCSNAALGPGFWPSRLSFRLVTVHSQQLILA